MSRSGGIGQFLKGLIMGVVLILAIIGTMSMLDKNKDNNNTVATTQVTNTNAAQTNSEIKAPEINIASPTSTETPTQEVTPTMVELKRAEPKKDNFQPVLEGEKNKAEIQAEEIKKQTEAIKFGILKLTAINPANKKNLKANFAVFDDKNTKIAESNNTASTSYRLPTGSYRVITTLVKPTDSSTRETEPVQSTNTITISANKLTDQIIELEPPTTIGILQVSAISAKNNKAIKANFIIQKENGEIVASRQNVANSLFKLKSGSYKVTVKSGNNSDFRTIVVEPGKSAEEVFNLHESFTQGKVLVRIFDIRSNQPVRADIKISNQSGKTMQALKAVSQTEIALAEGDYKIKVVGSKGESSKNIRVVAGQSSSQVFRIDAPSVSSSNEPVKINENVKISAVDETTSDKTETTSETESLPVKSMLKLFARNEVDQKPIKSNFYVQTPNGKNISKKIYADSAEFDLDPGRYKITVRSKNRKNIVRTIQVVANQAITEVFSLQRNIPTSSTDNPAPVLAAPKPSQSPRTIPNGFLNVVMRPAKKTHFIIADRKGEKVVELTSVASGNFKLDTGIYVVTAILNGQRRKQTIRVYQGKTSQLSFNANNFQKNTATNKSNAVNKGKLRSRIIDNAGRPLKANLIVTNALGQVVARANNVTFGVFDLPATPHTVIVNYKGLSGSERVNIAAGKTTVQTFTISPNTPNNINSAPQNPNPAQPPRDANDILRDKLKEELRRIF